MKFLKHQAAHLQKALLNHTIFSTSQTGETVPLSMLFMGSEYSMLTAVRYYRLYRAITSARVAVEAQWWVLAKVPPVATMTQVGGGVQGVADWRRALGGGTSSSYVAQVGTIHVGVQQWRGECSCWVPARVRRSYPVRSEYKQIWSEHLFASKWIKWLYSLVSHRSESANFICETNIDCKRIFASSKYLKRNEANIL